MNAISSKRLHNKAKKALGELNKIRYCNGLLDLQFEHQHEETKRNLYKSIDYLKSFIDNIDNFNF